MRNPWGQRNSYSGPWSPRTPEWNKVSDNVKKELNYTDDGDGNFFISYEDFLKQFDDVDFVHVDLNAFYSTDSDYNNTFKWINKTFVGSWVKGKNAGGTYTHNSRKN